MAENEKRKEWNLERKETRPTPKQTLIKVKSFFQYLNMTYFIAI
jgi:hypothetical protein